MSEYVKLAKDIERSVKERVGSTIVVMQKDAKRIFLEICSEAGLSPQTSATSFVAFLCNECRVNTALDQALDTHLRAKWETLGDLEDGIAILQRHL